METVVALVKNGVVVNTIVVEGNLAIFKSKSPSFIASFDAVVEFAADDNSRPSIGWTYADGSFHPPVAE